MKNVAVIVFFYMQVTNVFAENQKAKPTGKMASEVCLVSVTKAAKDLEAKRVHLDVSKIQTIDKRLLGSGSGTFLYSIFVDSPNTADHTHWEIVGEFSFDDDSCKPVYSKRFEAP